MSSESTAPTEANRNVLITGVSSGIGLGLTRELLRRGTTVYGLCRHAPELGKTDRFHFVPCDLSRPRDIPSALHRLLPEVAELDLVILNAGILGTFGDLPEQTPEEIQRVMQVNLWANKQLIDLLFDGSLSIRQVVTMSSAVSVKSYRGWGAYAISKAALNMLTGLAAAEHPETHFCALAPGLVDTAMQDQLCSYQADPLYPSIELLLSCRGTDKMPDVDEAAPLLLNLIQQLPEQVVSGSYADIRKPPLSELTV